MWVFDPEALVFQGRNGDWDRSPRALVRRNELDLSERNVCHRRHVVKEGGEVGKIPLKSASSKNVRENPGQRRESSLDSHPRLERRAHRVERLRRDYTALGLR